MSGAAPELLFPFPAAPGVRAAFSTRNGGVSRGAHASLNLGFRSGDDPENVRRNWSLALSAAGLPPSPVALPKMTHGDAMAEITEDMIRAAPPGSLIEPPDADAVFTRASGVALAVTMADCLTALIHDPGSGLIAAVHAGWRGTRAGILRKCLSCLALEHPLDPRTTLIAFGPCLRPDALEVGPEVAAQLDPRFIRSVAAGGKTRHLYDMPGDNRAQALACGIRPENLRDMGGCSLSEPERYFSYRRDGQVSGRMAAFIARL